MTDDAHPEISNMEVYHFSALIGKRCERLGKKYPLPIKDIYFLKRLYVELERSGRLGSFIENMDKLTDQKWDDLSIEEMLNNA